MVQGRGQGSEAMAPGRGATYPAPDPGRCPVCGAALSEVGGITICILCGFTASHGLAPRLWVLDNELARLSCERASLIEQIRRDGADVPAPLAVAPPAPSTPVAGAVPATEPAARTVPAQVLLVGVGAVLLVLAGVAFVVVTWERLGASGQAAVLMVATGAAVVATVVAARSRLSATAEALAVVATGFALIGVHAARVAFAPEGEWRWAWALGLAAVTAGLLALGRIGSVRGPPLMAAITAQLPAVIVATAFDDSGPTAAAALVLTAALDHIVAGSSKESRGRWLPGPAPRLLHLLGLGTWVLGVLLALPWALATAATGSGSERWWGIAVLSVATLDVAALARAGPVRDPFACAAAGMATASGLAVVLAIAAGSMSGIGLLLVASAAPVIPFGASVVLARRNRNGVDPRLRTVQIVSGAWMAGAWPGWALPVLVCLAAPLRALMDHGWWTFGPGVTIDDLQLPRTIGDFPRGRATTAMLAGVAIATAALSIVAASLPGERLRRRGPTAVLGVGCLVAVGVASVSYDRAVAVPFGVYLVSAAALALVAVRPGRRRVPGMALGALVALVYCLAWAASVDVFTVVALAVATIVSGVVVWRSVIERQREWAEPSTGVAVVVLALTALSAALAMGMTSSEALLVTVGLTAAASGIGWVADRWAAWWAPIVDAVVAATVAVALVALGTLGGAGFLIAGLGIVTVVAAIHISRPSRREAAASFAAGAGLLLLWLVLWAHGVRVADAYSLPVAALLLAGGWWWQRRDPSVGSWPALGPALLVAALPSVFAAITEPGIVRPFVVFGAAVAVTVAGAVGHLRAPLVIGSITMVVIAMDQVSPVVAWVPRWIVIGAGGIAMLAIGASFERQRRRLADTYQRYRAFR